MHKITKRNGVTVDLNRQVTLCLQELIVWMHTCLYCTQLWYIVQHSSDNLPPVIQHGSDVAYCMGAGSEYEDGGYN